MAKRVFPSFWYFPPNFKSNFHLFYSMHSCFIGSNHLFYFLNLSDFNIWVGGRVWKNVLFYRMFPPFYFLRVSDFDIFGWEVGQLLIWPCFNRIFFQSTRHHIFKKNGCMIPDALMMLWWWQWSLWLCLVCTVYYHLHALYLIRY